MSTRKETSIKTQKREQDVLLWSFFFLSSALQDNLPDFTHDSQHVYESLHLLLPVGSARSHKYLQLCEAAQLQRCVVDSQKKKKRERERDRVGHH